MKKTLFPTPKDLLNAIRAANSEATVRQLVIEQLDCPDIKLEEGKADAKHENILIEFKLDEDMQHKEGKRAEILAQALYYCRYDYLDGKRMPAYVALIDKDEFVFYERQPLEAIYKDESWFKKGTPSMPDEAVIAVCKRIDPYLYIFTHTASDLDSAIRQLRQIVHSQTALAEDITEYNIFNLHDAWGNAFTQFLDPKGKENKPHVFRKDCVGDREIFVIESNIFGNELITIHFNLDNEIAKIERCPRSQYDTFWGRGIVSRIPNWKKLFSRKPPPCLRWKVVVARDNFTLLLI